MTFILQFKSIYEKNCSPIGPCIVNSPIDNYIINIMTQQKEYPRRDTHKN